MQNFLSGGSLVNIHLLTILFKRDILFFSKKRKVLIAIRRIPGYIVIQDQERYLCRMPDFKQKGKRIERSCLYH